MGQLSGGGNYPGGSCPGGNCPGSKCPGDNCLGGSYPGGNYPGASCPGGKCPGQMETGLFKRSNAFLSIISACKILGKCSESFIDKKFKAGE